MADRPDRQGVLIGFAVLAPILYVLSIGPVAKVLFTVSPHGHLPKKVLGVVYAPLALVAIYGPSGAGDLIEAYVRLWVKR